MVDQVRGEIETDFADYISKCYPSMELPPDQLKELRMAFYAGHWNVVCWDGPGSAARRKSLAAECVRFKESVR